MLLAIFVANFSIMQNIANFRNACNKIPYFLTLLKTLVPVPCYFYGVYRGKNRLYMSCAYL